MSWIFAALALLAPLVMLFGAPIDATGGVDAWRLAAWFGSAIGYAVVIGRWGLVTRGTIFGVIIDRRKRMSLSRFQIVLWTLLVLPTLTVGLLGNVFRAPSADAIVVMQIEWSLVALMGLSVGSFLAAPAALSLKTNREADVAERAAAVEPDDSAANGEVTPSGVSTATPATETEGQVLKNRSAKDASLSELILGEETGNARALDIARLQMLAITLIVWAAYLSTVLYQFGSHDPAVPYIVELTALNPQLLTLIMVSHGGYIAGKVVPNSAAPKQVATRELSRALDLRAHVQSLLSQIVATLKTDNQLSPIEEKHLELLKSQLGRLLTASEPLPVDVGNGTSIAAKLGNLEGQLESVRRSYVGVSSQGVRPADVDSPPRETVRALKRALNDAGFGKLESTGPWGKADEAALGRMLASLDLTRDDLDQREYRAFEDALELLEAA